MPDVLLVALIVAGAVIVGVLAVAVAMAPRRVVSIPLDDWPVGDPRFKLSDKELRRILRESRRHFPSEPDGGQNDG